jgi:hypothetical protein
MLNRFGLLLALGLIVSTPVAAQVTITDTHEGGKPVPKPAPFNMKSLTQGQNVSQQTPLSNRAIIQMVQSGKASRKPRFWQPYAQVAATSTFHPGDAQLFAALMSARPFLMRWAAVVGRNALRQCRVQVPFKASPQAVCSWESEMRPC